MKSTTQSTITILSAVGAATLPASAAIIYTDLGAGVSTDYTSSIFFSLSEQWAGNSVPGGSSYEFELRFDSKPEVAPSAIPQIYGAGYSESVRDGSWATKMSGGDVVDSSLSFNWLNNINQQGINDANWAAGTRGFLGLKTGNPVAGDFYGWADIEYTADQELRLYGFAYEDSGASIEIIPEPSTPLLCALAAGSAALFQRRRRVAC